MNRTVVTIQQLSEQLGLTSRTLRHWEAEGLFQSYREVSSGWRTYDEQALRCIRITALLRRMDIPIKEIQAVLDKSSVPVLKQVIQNRLIALQAHQEELERVGQQLQKLVEKAHSFRGGMNRLCLRDILMLSKLTILQKYQNYLIIN
ncbi:MerR family transcriptional regulator [Paenibacillus sp. FSL H8-0332]|uniref:MerR family transcriptional regulator n=1 Tax=Paenibacillus sp. FSL H8-0332 TaxID=2954742 RepID=UPI0030D5E847